MGRLLPVALLVVLAGACSSGESPAVEPDPTVSTTLDAPGSSTTIHAEPQTPAGEVSPAAAAAAFVRAWEDGDRDGAARVAQKAAIQSLFATPYAPPPPVTRGCSDPAPTDAGGERSDCVYRYGQGLLRVAVERASNVAKWVVASAALES